MKTRCCIILFVLLVSAAVCAQAQVSLKLYDDDRAKLIDPSTWSAVDWRDGQTLDLKAFSANRTFRGIWSSANTPDSMTTAALTPGNISSSASATRRIGMKQQAQYGIASRSE